MPVSRNSSNSQNALVGTRPTINDPAYGSTSWELRDKLAEVLQALRNRGVISPIGGITLDYYSYLLSLNPWAFAPMNDPGSALLNTTGATIGTYSGTYGNNQTNLISRLPDAKSTRFNSGGAGINALQTNPQIFTLVARVSMTATATGSLFGFTNNVGFSGQSQADREVFIEPDGRIAFRIWTGGDSRIRTPAAYRDSGARTIAIRRDTAGVSSIWIDGVKVSEGAIGAPLAYNGYWKVGFSGLSGVGFANGINMQGVALFNYGLSDSQIGTIQSFV